MKEISKKEFLKIVIPKGESNKQKVLNFLMKRGSLGASSKELKEVYYRFSASIFDLKNLDGYLIRDVPINKGLVMYFYEGFNPNHQPPKSSKERVFERLEKLGADTKFLAMLEVALEDEYATIKGK